MKSLLQTLGALGRFARKDLLRIVIPIALLALVASVVTGMERPSIVPEPTGRLDTRMRGQDVALPSFDLSALARDTEPQARPLEAVRDPFAQRSFAPQAQRAAGAAAAPSTPQLPFVYLGRMVEDGKLAVFLARGAQSYSVQRAQQLDAEYRVDKVTESRVTFTYLPTKQKQTLDIPAVN